jgi:hypothetical protein
LSLLPSVQNRKSKSRQTIRVINPAPVASELKPRRSRGIRCIRWFGDQSVHESKISGLLTYELVVTAGLATALKTKTLCALRVLCVRKQMHSRKGRQERKGRTTPNTFPVNFRLHAELC